MSFTTPVHFIRVAAAVAVVSLSLSAATVSVGWLQPPPMTIPWNELFYVHAEASTDEVVETLAVSILKGGVEVASNFVENGTQVDCGYLTTVTSDNTWIMIVGSQVWPLPPAVLSNVINDVTAPSTPTGLSASNPTSTSFTLSWQPSNDEGGIAGYEVVRATVSLGFATGTSRLLDMPPPGEQYEFSVRARDLAGNWSAFSSALQVPVGGAGTPTAPTNLASPAQAYNSVSLTWSAGTADGTIVGYDIYRSVSGGTEQLVGFSSTLSFTDTHVVPGMTYLYRLKTRDATGRVSPPSSTLSATTPGLADQDGDGLPDIVETLLQTPANTAATETNLSLNPHRPQQ